MANNLNTRGTNDRNRASVVGDGKYISVRNDKLKFDAKGVIEAGRMKDIEAEFKVLVSEARDISSDVNSESTILIKDMQLAYPGGGVASMFPIKDIVVEYRETTGQETTRMTKDKASKFRNGYLVTYASVGIKTEVLDWIINSSDHGHSSLDNVVPKAQYKGGYTWLPVKIPDSKPIIVTATMGGIAKGVGKIANFFLSTKSNVIGHGIFTIRYMAMGEGAEADDPEYTLGLTLTTFQAVDTTTIASPPLNNKAAGIVFDQEIGPSLRKILNRAHAGGSGDVDDREDTASSLGRTLAASTPGFELAPGASLGPHDNEHQVPLAGSGAH